MSLDFDIRDPVTGELLGDFNITHNVNKIADAVGVYKHLWRPEEINVTHAGQLIIPLHEAVQKLKADPEAFRHLEPSNKWGTCESLINFIEKILAIAVKNPHAVISISR